MTFEGSHLYGILKMLLMKFERPNKIKMVFKSEYFPPVIFPKQWEVNGRLWQFSYEIEISPILEYTESYHFFYSPKPTNRGRRRRRDHGNLKPLIRGMSSEKSWRKQEENGSPKFALTFSSSPRFFPFQILPCNSISFFFFLFFSFMFSHGSLSLFRYLTDL